MLTGRKLLVMRTAVTALDASAASCGYKAATILADAQFPKMQPT
jgi:hypothetical protein